MKIEKEDVVAILRNRARDKGKVIREYDFEEVADDIVAHSRKSHVQFTNKANDRQRTLSKLPQ